MAYMGAFSTWTGNILEMRACKRYPIIYRVGTVVGTVVGTAVGTVVGTAVAMPTHILQCFCTR